VTLRVEDRDGGAQFAVKAVPGSSRDRIQGLYGDALKVAVAAPPERGKANEAICALLASALGVPERNVSVIAGGTSPRKTLRVLGLTADDVRQRLAL
jgi:uncharacterized protein (TIGR00251 family)